MMKLCVNFSKVKVLCLPRFCVDRKNTLKEGREGRG